MVNVYSSNIFFSRVADGWWLGPDGETLLIPKDEGICIMISAFQSRGFGFWFAWDDLSDADLKRINDFRA